MLRNILRKTTLAAAGLTAAGLGAAIFAGAPDRATADEFLPGPSVTYVTFEGTLELLDQPVFVLASGMPVGGTSAQLGLNTVPVPTIPGASYSAISPTTGPVEAAVGGVDVWDDGDEL